MNIAVKIKQEFPERVLLKGKRPIVIIGTGPVGIRFLEQLHTELLYHPVVIYGGEPWIPYNRVRLSSLLAGDINHDDLVLSTDTIKLNPVITRYNCRIVQINRDNKSLMSLVVGRIMKN